MQTHLLHENDIKTITMVLVCKDIGLCPSMILFQLFDVSFVRPRPCKGHGFSHWFFVEEVLPYIVWFRTRENKFFWWYFLLGLALYFSISHMMNWVFLTVESILQIWIGLGVEWVSTWSGWVKLGRCSFAIVVSRVGKWIEEKLMKEACAQVISVHRPHTKTQPDLSKQPLWILKHLPRSFEKVMAMATFSCCVRLSWVPTFFSSY